MKYFYFFILLIAFSISANAQLRFTKLVIQSGETFSFGQSDILVVDTLIMNDSSGIVLNKLNAENYLHVKVAVIGRYCFIDGNGIAGKPGTNGKKGISSAGPCKSGTNGGDAADGEKGLDGVDLLVYLQKVSIQGSITINLHGGRGGDGGNGGEGGSAGSGTVHCKGGNGGNGGKGGQGGYGGDGGSLTIHGPTSLHSLLENNVKLSAKGGQFGKAGRGGYSGYGGLGPRGKTGNNGLQGADGYDGSLGNNGRMNLVEN